MITLRDSPRNADGEPEFLWIPLPDTSVREIDTLCASLGVRAPVLIGSAFEVLGEIREVTPPQRLFLARDDFRLLPFDVLVLSSLRDTAVHTLNSEPTVDHFPLELDDAQRAVLACMMERHYVYDVAIRAVMAVRATRLVREITTMGYEIFVGDNGGLTGTVALPEIVQSMAAADRVDDIISRDLEALFDGTLAPFDGNRSIDGIELEFPFEP
jgi:hypothetical protein